MFVLRPNQVPALEDAVNFFSQPSPKPGILVAPTAFGKSILIARLVSEISGSTLVLQPSKELLEQNYRKYIMLGGRATIYSAAFGIKRLSDTVYATIGSIKNIGHAFEKMGFQNLIIDEVHQYPRGAESMLGRFMQDSNIKKVLGLTATPFKLQSNTDINGEHFSKLQMLTSRSKHGQFFQDIIHVAQIKEMVDMKYWSPLEYEIGDFDDSALVYNSVKSDYTEASLIHAFQDQDIESKIVRRISRLDRKSIIVFVPTIAEALSLAARIPGAYAVHSEMHDVARARVIDGFRNGTIRCVVNVNILATGFDHPGVDCIIGARPTASLAWLYQALGRGTRIHPDKKDCLIIDYAGNINRFGRIEHIYFKKKKSWQCYGEGGRLMTGIAMDQIGSILDAPVSGVTIPFGKYKGKDISVVPKDYLKWMLNDFTWTDKNYYIKEAAEKMLNQAV